MREKSSNTIIFKRLSLLYSEMERAYDLTANQLGLSCQSCPDNCCTSYFLHHTYIEWAYLWEGIRSCNDERQQGFLRRATDYVNEAKALPAEEVKVQIMCPLNENGFCRLYEYRLMICRMHGVPNSFVRPDGKKLSFPGCFRCQELYSESATAPVLDRTDFYRNLANLEMEFLGEKARNLPRVRLTLAEMLTQGPPEIQ